MIAKVVNLPNFYFKKKQPALTPLMIDTLLAACAKQNEKIPFGPCDIKRSFVALVNRGLITRKYIVINDGSVQLWQVTTEAIKMLSDAGIEVAFK